MAPKRAVAYILSFELPPDEAYCLIECDVRGKSHAEAADVIQKYRQEHDEPPDGMKDLYDYLHKKQIERAADVRRLQDMFRE